MRSAGRRPRALLHAGGLHGGLGGLDHHPRQPGGRADAARSTRTASWGATTGTPTRQPDQRVRPDLPPHDGRARLTTVEAFYPEPLNRWYDVEAVPVGRRHPLLLLRRQRAAGGPGPAGAAGPGRRRAGRHPRRRRRGGPHPAARRPRPRRRLPGHRASTRRAAPAGVGSWHVDPEAAAAGGAVRRGPAGGPAWRRAAHAGAAGRRDGRLLRCAGDGGRCPTARRARWLERSGSGYGLTLPLRGHARIVGALTLLLRRARSRRATAALVTARQVADRIGAGAGQRAAVRPAAPARGGAAAQPAHRAGAASRRRDRRPLHARRRGGPGRRRLVRRLPAAFGGDDAGHRRRRRARHRGRRVDGAAARPAARHRHLQRRGAGRGPPRARRRDGPAADGHLRHRRGRPLRAASDGAGAAASPGCAGRTPGTCRCW